MKSPDSNDDTTSSKYNVQIGEGKGIVIGDNPHVEQHFYDTPAELQLDLAAAEATYRQKVVDAYKWLHFGGFASPDLSLANVPLEEVFVRLTLTVEKVIREPVPSEKASQAERGESRQRERVITVQEPVELGQALSSHLLIVGEPGAGKSTLLRWLSVTFAQGHQREPNRLGPSADADRLPVLVELGRLPDRYLKPEGGETPNWLQFLPEYLPAQMAFNNTSPQLLSRALADGRCLLLFDGLDEVADRQVRTRLARSLVELARLFPDNRVIIGSRPAGTSESEGALRPHFQRCRIERFTPKDVQRFFRFWYALDRGLTPEQQLDAADALYARVKATPATLQLASTPLLSTILVLIWRNEGDLPKRRVELYERCCRVLIERWEASHDVAYQGAMADMDWEDHLRLLTQLAYAIHSQEQRTNATREELVPLLVQALQAAGYAKEQATVTREAKQFLDALGLRSGLLQYMGDDRYGFAHQIFQEYLAARYVAAQPDPDYIDLVMTHLHESWWQQVHLLTIGQLGSGSAKASKASALILTILHVYRPPSRILRSSKNGWARLIGPGKFLPQAQLDRRIAWMLARELELAARGYAECAPDGIKAAVNTALLAQANSLTQHIINDRARFLGQREVFTGIFRVLPRQANEVAVTTLIQMLQHVTRLARRQLTTLIQELLEGDEWDVRRQAVDSLGQIGAGNEAAITALVQALQDDNSEVRRWVAQSLGQIGAGNEAAITALVQALQDDNSEVHRQALKSLGQVGAANEVVVTALVALRVHNRDGRELVAEGLGQIGAGNEAAITALVQALQHDVWDVRWRAARSLGQIGAGNEAAITALIQALQDYNWDVRRWVAQSLGQIGAGNEAAITALIQALQDQEEGVRSRAAQSLGQVGAGNETAVTALIQALQDHNSEVRRQALKSLGQVGADNEAAVTALIQALPDHNSEVRKQVAEGLGQVEAGNEAVVTALVQALQHDVWVERGQAAKSLGRVEAGNEAAITALVQALQHDHWNERSQAAKSLGRVEIKDTMHLRKVLVALNHCLYNWHNEVRGAALASIRQLLDGRPLPSYRWVPLRKRRAQRLRLKRFAFWLGMSAMMVLIGLAATWLLGALDPNGFPVRFLAVLAGIAAFVAAVAQVLGRTLRDPWENS